MRRRTSARNNSGPLVFPSSLMGAVLKTIMVIHFFFKVYVGQGVVRLWLKKGFLWMEKGWAAGCNGIWWRDWGGGHLESTWHSIDFVPILMELQKYLRGIPLRSNWSAVIMYSQSFSRCGWPPLALPGLSGSYLWVLFLHLPVSWKRQHSNGLKCFS